MFPRYESLMPFMSRVLQPAPNLSQGGPTAGERTTRHTLHEGRKVSVNESMCAHCHAPKSLPTIQALYAHEAIIRIQSSRQCISPLFHMVLDGLAIGRVAVGMGNVICEPTHTCTFFAYQLIKYPGILDVRRTCHLLTLI